ncbi:MAG: pyridoxal phosphate-dependent aminotransferase [Bacteroidales bacterium]|nr:pyridoxal phosphate-dependent aminotransferase [Candidatus Colicola faecequi]
MTFPLDKQLVDQTCMDFGLMDAHELGQATIRQMVGVVKEIESRTGCKYVHMELGNPGLPAEKIGVEAQCRALQDGVANQYPIIVGIDPLRHWASEFFKAFFNLHIPEDCIVPCVGSMQGCFALDTLIHQLRLDRDTILFIDPCFPVQKQQCRVIGIHVDTLEIGNYRGEKFRDALEEKLRSGHISAILFSNPNNPSWMCLSEEELRIMGQLADRYDTIVIEDSAYLNMDFRDPNRGVPYQAPYQPSVGRYTRNCVHLVSCSKIFSYAGERAAVIAVHPELAKRHFPALTERYHNDGQFMRTLIYQTLYALSSGTPHSVQYAIAALFEAACKGEINFTENTREYARRAGKIKEIMLRNGFHIVYDKDADGQEVGDGFFFTFGYKDWTGEQLLNKIIYYGVSAITLSSTGALREGMRGCASAITEDQFDVLEERLRQFNEDYKDYVHPA